MKLKRRHQRKNRFGEQVTPHGVPHRLTGINCRILNDSRRHRDQQVGQADDVIEMSVTQQDMKISGLCPGRDSEHAGAGVQDNSQFRDKDARGVSPFVGVIAPRPQELDGIRAPPWRQLPPV